MKRSKILPISIGLFLSLASVTTNAEMKANLTGNVYIKIDALLLSSGIVDEKFHLIDEQQAKYFFKQLTNDLHQEVSDSFDTEAVTTTMTFEINRVVFTIKGRNPMPKEVLNNPENLRVPNNLMILNCEELYSSKYAQANDYSMLIQLIDSDNTLLAQTKIDKALCKSFRY